MCELCCCIYNCIFSHMSRDTLYIWLKTDLYLATHDFLRPMLRNYELNLESVYSTGTSLSTYLQKQIHFTF